MLHGYTGCLGWNGTGPTRATAATGPTRAATATRERQQVLSVCPGRLTFLYFHFYVLIGVLLKGMVESSLLSKDELLIPDIDEVIAL